MASPLQEEEAMRPAKVYLTLDPALLEQAPEKYMKTWVDTPVPPRFHRDDKILDHSLVSNNMDLLRLTYAYVSHKVCPVKNENTMMERERKGLSSKKRLPNDYYKPYDEAALQDEQVWPAAKLKSSIVESCKIWDTERRKHIRMSEQLGKSESKFTETMAQADDNMSITVNGMNARDDLSASQSKESTPQAATRSKQSQSAKRGHRMSSGAATKRKSAIKEDDDAEAGAQEPEAKKPRKGRPRKLISDDTLRQPANDETQPQMLAGWELWGEEQEGAGVPAVVYPPRYFKQEAKASGRTLHQPIEGADDVYRAGLALSTSTAGGDIGGVPHPNHVLLQNSTRMSSDGLPGVIFCPTNVAPYSSVSAGGDHFLPQHTNGYGAVNANSHTHSSPTGSFQTRHDTPMAGHTNSESDYGTFFGSFNNSLVNTSDQDHAGAVAHTNFDSNATALCDFFNNPTDTTGTHHEMIDTAHPSFDSGYGTASSSFNNPTATMGAENHTSFTAQPSLDGEYTLASGSIHDQIAAINAQVHASIADDPSYDRARGMFTNPTVTTGTQDHTPLIDHPDFDIDHVTASNTLINGGHNPLAGWIDTIIARSKTGAQESFVTGMEDNFTEAFAERHHDEDAL